MSLVANWFGRVEFKYLFLFSTGMSKYLKKSKQIVYEIRHIQIDELPRTKFKKTEPKNSTQLSLLTSEQL